MCCKQPCSSVGEGARASALSRRSWAQSPDHNTNQALKIILEKKKVIGNFMLRCRYTPSFEDLKACFRRRTKKIPKSVGAHTQPCFTPILPQTHLRCPRCSSCRHDMTLQDSKVVHNSC